ncbi:BON domain-containing protein [Candidatus Nitronereus thalassa]|uniref:BON domain-containing protein n=1 Tax=Candidatus Nitronereus thalassa TaxID=3020898 RepID=A0ABU3KBE3_9BACT|nr:BON domain-containing protein [Candidatus Nitronereus thalassa]MDT7043740.1 BON domain-containing protein [Candidatus Nitronereus thalassa]
MFNQRRTLNGIMVGTIMTVFLCVGVGLAKEVGELTDGRMEGAIERRLEMDSRIISNAIGVTVKDGHVRLFGSVDTLQEHGQATQVASSVIGVKSVHNTIEIRPNPKPDQHIRNEISTRLKESALIKDDHIDIRVSNRVVTLMGTAPSQSALRQAQHVAESTPGVRKVENLLGLQGSDRSDELIHKDVLDYLLWSPLADLPDFNVSVKQGVVTLEGTVAHLIHKDVLAMDIINIHGVKNVKVGKVIPESFEISLKDQ